MEIRTFDMFCGAGGSSHGAAMADVKPVAGLDMWKLAADTYKLNFPDSIVYNIKAEDVSPKRIKDEVGPIDLILASPECTNHSVAKGNIPRCEKSRETAFQVLRFAKIFNPRWIIVENVMQMQKWKRFKEWIGKINAMGYQIRERIIDSQFHGTPQSRRRLFVVCDLEAEPILPEKGPKTDDTVFDIIGTGESKEKPWKFNPLRTPRRARATIERAQRAIQALGDGVPFIMVYYGTDGAGGFQTINRPLRTVTTLDRFAYVRPNGNCYEMRMLQPPELAAAMGFTKAHVWPDCSRREKIKLIGNAVCPPVMRDVVKSLTSSP